MTSNVVSISQKKDLGKQMLSQSKFYMGYSRWDDEKDGYETWDESVDRVINMHKEKYAHVMTSELESIIDFAGVAYKDQMVLGAQRALQFGGEQLFKHVARMYNCVSTHIDRPESFQESMYLLLCGCGVGFSVQEQHISQLPNIRKRYEKKSKVFVVNDSIEGWADAFGVLLSSFFEENSPFPEYRGCHVAFDYSQIRPKGAKISGGFKAPGPDGLRIALQKCEDLLVSQILNGEEKIKPIIAYDFIMHMADAVLSGGVRRSATICMFSKDDEEMMNAKTGDWFINNPQRGRSNNSVMLLRDEINREEWAEIMKSVKSFGEPGFIFTDNLEFTFNPCLTGDTILSVKEHNLTNNGKIVGVGQEYKIPLKMYVDNFIGDGSDPLVLSYNTETGENEYCSVTAAALTRKNADVIELILEDEKVVRCTPDHKIYTTNRGWVKASSITEDDDLVVN